LDDQIEKNEGAEHVTRMGKSRSVYRNLVVNLRERDYFEDPGIDG
jgi:hypothetical protein